MKIPRFFKPPANPMLKNSLPPRAINSSKIVTAFGAPIPVLYTKPTSLCMYNVIKLYSFIFLGLYFLLK